MLVERWVCIHQLLTKLLLSRLYRKPQLLRHFRRLFDPLLLVNFMSRIRSSSKQFLTMFVAIGLTVGAIAFASGDQATAGPTASAQASYAILKATPNAEDRANLQVRDVASKSKSVVLDADGARVLRTIGRNRVWIVPAEGHVCVGIEPVEKESVRFALVCDTTATAALKGVAIEFGGQIVGVVPDGADTVEASESSGATTEASVLRNLYVLPKGQYTARFTTKDGPQQAGLNK